ncbi:waprin-Phi2-like [Tubulanus polymorphus]|uniref:waprin-Phi2-like n=1 Tax=Tubulanus polymorphus TaxID=672921 RepID=UPI003DA4AA2D
MFLTVVSLFLVSIAISSANPGLCPKLEEGQTGRCGLYCTSDNECKYEERCCNNGCGQECTPSVPIPDFGRPKNNKRGVCVEECQTNDDCSGSQECFDTGCGHICT